MNLQYVTVPLTHEDSALPFLRYAVPHDAFAAHSSAWVEQQVVRIDDNTQYETVHLNEPSGEIFPLGNFIR